MNEIVNQDQEDEKQKRDPFRVKPVSQKRMYQN